MRNHVSTRLEMIKKCVPREARWRQGGVAAREAFADLEALSEEFLPMIAAFGLTNATLVYAAPTDGTAVRRVLFEKQTSGWEKLYLERMYHLADPTVSEMLRSPDAFFWSELTARRGRLTNSENRVLRDAARFGFREGFVAPRRSPDGLVRAIAFCGAGPVLDTNRARLTLSSAADELFGKLQDTGISALSRSRKSLLLRSRQIECLHWAALGKTSLEIGMILSLSRKTVDEHIENACRKFGVNGRIQAVARAIDIGIIELR